MEECEELCDTICIIKDGIIAKDSTPASLISELGNYFQVTLSVAADGDAKTNIAKIEELMRTLSPNLTVKDLLVCLLTQRSGDESVVLFLTVAPGACVALAHPSSSSAFLARLIVLGRARQ